MTTGSVMWTEVATGAEARSVRRWLQRVVPPMLLRYLFVLLLVLVMGVVFSFVLPDAPSFCAIPEGCG